MNPWINYHHLFYFMTIAEEQSVSKAAEKLRLGQSTLSAQLKQFESVLGVVLFERQHKKLILTEHGRVALDYAKNIFKMGSEMVEVLHDRLKPTRPTICIGALDSVPKQVLVSLTKASLKISDCHITLIEGKSDELLRELTAHRIDLIVTNFVPTALVTKNLFHRSFAKNKIALFGAPKFKNLRKNFPQSLRDQPILLPTYDSKLRYDLDHWSQLMKLDLNTLTETQDVALKTLMAVNKLGLLPAAVDSVSHHIQNNELIEIGKLENVHEELFLVSAQRKIENVIAKQLMKSFSL